MTHPAFTAFPGSHGMWVGKFETGYKGATSTSDAQKNVSDSTNVIIKPNVFSWRNITVGNAFKTSLKYETTLESHLMKNTEWGAIAYLTQSIYGMCTNNESTTCNEVTINSNTNYVTGYTGPSTAYPNSTASSTTGNNTGIFDMSGGSWEYVIGYMSDNVKSSGLLEETDLTVENSKYFDKYENKTDMEWSKRILGDATGELEPFGMERSDRISSWYKDWAWFPNSYNPWFGRGGAG